MKKTHKNLITNISLAYASLIFIVLPTFFPVFNNKIIYLNAALLLLGVYMYTKTKNKVFLFLNMIVFVLNEILYNMCVVDIYPPSEKTKMFYDITDIYHYSSGRGTGNYTEGYYPDEESKTESQEANDIRKFNYWIDLMNIVPGETVLEAGCGSGEFLKYLKTQGVNVVGITLSEETTVRLNKEGIQCYRHDYRLPNKQLDNRFDHIFFPGSLEHLTQEMISCPNKLATAQTKKIKELIDNIVLWFKPESSKNNLFIAHLHVKPKYNKSFPAYLLERSYGGSYFPDKEGIRIFDAIRKANSKFTTTFVEDRTFDYYYVSVSNPKHFGYPGGFNDAFTTISALIAFLAAPFTYPFLWHMLLYDKLGIWMWQFDGEYHPLNCGINKCELTKERPVSLFYSISQYKPT